jgi:hypothetical protein
MTDPEFDLGSVMFGFLDDFDSEHDSTHNSNGTQEINFVGPCGR